MDSGPLVAAFNRGDPKHVECAAVLRRRDLTFLVSALAVAEACYHLEKASPAIEARFVEGLSRFDVEAPDAHDWPRIAELIRQYADLPLGATDASVVALAERHGTPLVFTLDERHFRAVRPRHCEAFTLLPG